MVIRWQTNDACLTCLNIYSDVLSGEYQWYTIKYGYAMCIAGAIAAIVGLYLGRWYNDRREK